MMKRPPKIRGLEKVKRPTKMKDTWRWSCKKPAYLESQRQDLLLCKGAAADDQSL